MCVNRLTGEVRTKVMFKFGPNDLNDCASVERGSLGFLGVAAACVKSKACRNHSRFKVPAGDYR